MWTRVLVPVLAVGMLLSLSGCAYLEDQQKAGAHFASWQHMGYSLFRATPKETTTGDVSTADDEKWWGDPILIEPIQ